MPTPQQPPPALDLPRHIYEAMLVHLVDVLPEEGCGFLAGTAVTVSHHYPIENHLHSPIAYEMEPGQQLSTMLAVEAAGLTLLAIYHSHPRGPIQPSVTDVTQAFYPELAHVIISRPAAKRPAIHAYTIRSGQINEIRLNLL